MNTAEISSALGALLSELVDGASKDGGYMLNPGDEGMLRSLEKLSGADASALTATGPPCPGQRGDSPSGR